MSEEIRPGVLYVVPTPIGNLDDITLRAIKILGGVDLVAAEDTRTTKFLLDHLGITKPIVSFFSHNQSMRTPQLIEKLQSGNSVALVSDAGTPGISDPAYALITAAIENQILIVPLPGPTAFIPALVASGMPTHEFVFIGFLPMKKGRRTELLRLKEEPRTIVLYESPHRLLKTLTEFLEVLGDRKCVVARELTKKFEEIRRAPLSAQLAHFSAAAIKGEFVLIVAGLEN
jgi:16S rRNA (cytidine1402-2'-O)-methyltransferase